MADVQAYSSEHEKSEGGGLNNWYDGPFRRSCEERKGIKFFILYFWIFIFHDNFTNLGTIKKN